MAASVATVLILVPKPYSLSLFSNIQYTLLFASFNRFSVEQKSKYIVVFVLAKNINMNMNLNLNMNMNMNMNNIGTNEVREYQIWGLTN